LEEDSKGSRQVELYGDDAKNSWRVIEAGRRRRRISREIRHPILSSLRESIEQECSVYY